MTYIPVATNTAEPVESQTVVSAAEEFRTLKTYTVAQVANVQAQIDALIVSGGTGTSAALVSLSPVGTVSATNVQAAIQELDSEKLSTSGVATNLTGTASGLTAGNVTTNANLTGHITSSGNTASLGSFTMAQLNTAVSDADLVPNATHSGDVTGSTALTVIGINGITLGALTTGILKNTTGTGQPSIASVLDYPTLNQNTTGTAANATNAVTAANLAGGLGGSIPYQTAAGATALLANGTSGQVLKSNGTTVAPSWSSAGTGTVTGVTSADANLTVATGTTTPVLTIVQAPALKSATTTVSVAAAAAPTTGQALIATSATTATWQTLAGGGNALTSGTLAQFAATTSAQLAGVISDETGSGALVFATSPTLVTPALGTPSALVGTNITGTAASLTAGAATLAASTSALKSATTTVNVASAAAPTAGQVLTASSGTTAAWVTPAGGGASATLTVSNKAAAYTVVAGDLGTVIANTGVNFDPITLPSCATVGVGFNFYYFNGGIPMVAVNTVGSDLIGTGTAGAASYTVSGGNSVKFVVVDASAGGKWFIEQGSIRGTDVGSLAMGTGARGFGVDSISIGTGSTANGVQAVGIAALSFATGAKSIAIGYDTRATSANSTAIGLGSAGQYAAAVTGAGAMALGGSYASGAASFSAAGHNNTGTYGAAGANSVAIGSTARSGGANSTALGTNASSPGIAAVAISTSAANGAYATGAGSVSIGSNSSAAGDASFAFGIYTVATQYGKYAYSAGGFGGNGEAQLGALVLRGSSAGAAVVLTSNQGAASTINQLIVATGQVMNFTGTIVGKQTGTTNVAAYKFAGCLLNSAGTVTMPYGGITEILSSVATWTAPTIAADNTNKGLTVNSGFLAATNTRWVCTIDSTELTYA